MKVEPLILRRLRASLSRLNYRLLGVLILMGLLPTVYMTVRVNFLGDLPGDWGYNIADSVFYGRGRTDLMLYQSLVVNSIFYGGAIGG